MTKVSKKANIRSSLSLERYLQEIGEVDLLTPEEEIELARIINYRPENDPEFKESGKPRYTEEDRQWALERLIRANLRFVVSVAKQYQNQGLSLADLINEGNLGLIKAAQRFDETRGFKFISYAVWWIRQSILQALAEQSRVVRLPLNKVTTINRLVKAYSELEHTLERDPLPEELAETLGMNPDEVSDTIKLNTRQVSIDAPLPTGDDSRIIDIMSDENQSPPDDNLMRQSKVEDILRVIKSLQPREARVLQLYFGIGTPQKTLEEIGEELKLTRERVRQIKEKAIRRLQHPSKAKILRPYL